MFIFYWALRTLFAFVEQGKAPPGAVPVPGWVRNSGLVKNEQMFTLPFRRLLTP